MNVHLHSLVLDGGYGCDADGAPSFLERNAARVVPQGPAARDPAAGDAAGGAGELKIVAAILQQAAIGRILTHLGLDPRPPPRGLERAPWAGAPALQPGWRLLAVSAFRPEPGIEARIANGGSGPRRSRTNLVPSRRKTGST